MIANPRLIDLDNLSHTSLVLLVHQSSFQLIERNRSRLQSAKDSVRIITFSVAFAVFVKLRPAGRKDVEQAGIVRIVGVVDDRVDQSDVRDRRAVAEVGGIALEECDSVSPFCRAPSAKVKSTLATALLPKTKYPLLSSIWPSRSKAS